MNQIKALLILILPVISHAQSITGTWEYEVLNTLSGDYFGELVIQKENDIYFGEIISNGDSYKVDFNYADLDSISISSIVEGYSATIDGVFLADKLKAQVSVLGDTNVYTLSAKKQLSEQLVKVVDSKSKEVIPYANVFFGKNGLITNDDGLCLIKTDPPSSKVIISAIGYESDTLIVSGHKSVEIIELVPANYMLPLIEIKAKGFTAKQIVDAAINNLSRNYIQQSYNANLFYRFSYFNNKDSLGYQSESILKFYDSKGYQKRGWRNAAKTRFSELQQGRITVGNHTDKIELGELNSIFFFWTHEPIVTKDKPISNRSLKAYEFSLVGIKEYQGVSVFEIDFECKKLKSRFTGLSSLKYMKGKIFINREDFAIIRYEHSNLREYEYSGRRIKKRGNLNERAIIENSRIELFSKSNEGYFLEYAKVINENERRNTLLNGVVKSFQNRTVEEFQYFDLITKDVEPLSNNLFELEIKTQYNDEYWKQFNLVLKSE